jgi:putative glutamine amidotransferase
MNENIEAWWDTRQGVIDTTITAVVAAGGLPVLLPNIGMETARGLYERIDGLLLAGGGDVNPTFYGAEPEHELDRLNPAMDKWELTLTSWAVLDGKPLFGICRGMQIINVALGGTLYQDIATDIRTDIDHRGSLLAEETAKLIHAMAVTEDSHLAALLGVTELDVNSLHHQALRDVAADLRVTATAPDGVVEAVEGTTAQYIMAVQSHPEAAAADDQRWQAVYDDFVAAAAGYAALRSITATKIAA